MAIMIVVLIGMSALAIDGSRAYRLRRDLQAAVDAAALAAGDTLQWTSSYPQAEQAASASFGMNLRLYGAPSCSPGFAAPGSSPLTVTCTYSDGSKLVDTISALGPRGSQFSLTASSPLSLQLARVLTNASSLTLAASSSARVGNLLYSPTIAAVSQAGCGGVPGNAITIASGGNLAVVGDVVSNGTITTGPGSANVAGDVYARCQASVPGVTNLCYPSGAAPPCTSPDVAGVTRTGYGFADPNYPAPVVAGGNQPAPGSSVVVQPGMYTADPAFSTGVCYFLAGGVYVWQGGYTNDGDFVSNELKPPDEPNATNNTLLAGHQFWNEDNHNCAGSAQFSVVSGFKDIPVGTWSFVVTSTRSTTYNGQSFLRESAPSVCYTAKITGANQNVLVRVSNVPGATAYNIYAGPSGSCGGPFGLAASLLVAGTPQNDSTGGCPVYSGPGCSLGNESITLSGATLGSGFSPNSAAPPGFPGAFPPTGETPPLRVNLPNENANRNAPPAGDRANENQCATVVGALTSCPGAVTPGAVAFVIPSGGCVNATTNGDTYVFSGYQYNWMVVYEPNTANPPANTCSNQFAAAIDSAFIGLIYTPSATITLRKASTFRTDEVGGIIASTLTFSGQLPTIIGDPGDYGPAPPASKLVS
jgi:Flp pilus assembly protein TadG